jgi:FtsZ-binding cell division protein ZapB
LINRIQVHQLEDENGFLRNEIEDFKQEIQKIEDINEEMRKKNNDLEEFVFFLQGKFELILFFGVFLNWEKNYKFFLFLF